MAFSWSRFGSWIIALIVGGVYGLAGTIAQSYMLDWFPLGLALAVIGSAALLAAVRLLTSDRWAALATGIGMMLTTLVFSGRGPGGSVIVPAAAPDAFPVGIVWTIAVPVLVALVVAWPDLSGIRRGDAEVAATPGEHVAELGASPTRLNP
ncbi:histidinol dehydrogenase [Microbacterium rhizomatis]|uniref:Histidinol dehydrogenase n=1 Tax=Microbacterium rhizomatis TaxID=1631477 RepID=A0A5J5J2E8_9MICO|nr:histidinol dehydrogenase [Microbacterium rhizomatis]KAA9110240.1 histidinol dehydrogenase [Microbacterium rhizomatis]